VRESLYVFAAIAPATGEMTALILPHCDTEAMNLFLQTLSSQFADRLVVLQTDRAGWHQSAPLQVPDNVRLLYQPAHSPELNPVEHLWDDLREKALANRAFKSLEKVQAALVTRLRELWDEPQALRSMTAFPWFKLRLDAAWYYLSQKLAEIDDFAKREELLQGDGPWVGGRLGASESLGRV
jgi:transposase